MLTYLKILVVIIMTIIPAKAEFYTGLTMGYHLKTTGLNDIHPYYGFKFGNIGTITYINSFRRLGFGAFYEFKDHANRDVQFNLKLGATTGYNPRMEYQGRSYRLSKKFFFNNDIMLLVIPGISFYMNDNDSFDLTVMGDSVNAGFTLRF